MFGPAQLANRLPAEVDRLFEGFLAPTPIVGRLELR